MEKSEDQFMMKYVVEWLYQVEDCDFQKLLLLQDAGMVLAHLKAIVPTNEGELKYLITASLDSTRTLDVYQESTRRVDVKGNTIITLGEETEEKASYFSQYIHTIDNEIQNDFPKDQQQRDSIRLAAMKDIDKTIIRIDENNKFTKFERKIDSFMLNRDLKPVVKAYRYMVRRSLN